MLEQKRTVGHIVREFPKTRDWYEIAEHLLTCTDDSFVRDHLHGATFSTGVAWGGLSRAFVEPLAVYGGWLEDPETPLSARVFAQKMVHELATGIEQEGLYEAEDEDR